MSTHFAARLSLVVMLLALFGLMVALPTQVAAQDVASITGVVSDPTGAVIAGVGVTLTDLQNGDTYKTVTNAQGSYTIDQVKPGPGYRIEFTREGFKAVVLAGLYMNVDATRTQNAQMSLGATDRDGRGFGCQSGCDPRHYRFDGRQQLSSPVSE